MKLIILIILIFCLYSLTNYTSEYFNSELNCNNIFYNFKNNIYLYENDSFYKISKNDFNYLQLKYNCQLINVKEKKTIEELGNIDEYCNNNLNKIDIEYDSCKKKCKFDPYCENKCSRKFDYLQCEKDISKKFYPLKDF